MRLHKLLFLAIFLVACSPAAQSAGRATITPYLSPTLAPYVAPLPATDTPTPEPPAYPAPLTIPPPLGVSWQPQALHVAWQSPGWHCVYLDTALIGCADDQASYDLPMGGVDVAYAPQLHRSVFLYDSEHNETAQVAIPARFVVWLVVVRR